MVRITAIERIGHVGLYNSVTLDANKKQTVMNNNHTVDFFNIPLALQQEVLGSWLTIYDVAMMDSAVCSKEVRTMFLDLLSKEDFVFINCEMDAKSIFSWMAWIVARKVCINQCHISKAVLPSLYKPFFACTGKRLETLMIESWKNEYKTSRMLHCAADVCTNLKIIFLLDFSSVRGLETLLQASQKTICNLILYECNLNGFQVDNCELPSLRHLIIDHCRNITNTSFEQLLRSACNLEVLCCFKLSHWSANVTFSPNLRVFAVSTTNITDAMVCSLVHSCPLLEVVRFENCTQLTDVSIIELVQHAKHLCSLFLGDNRNITDAAMEAIAEHCGERLKHLCLYGCDSITDNGLNILGKACHQLEGLGTSGDHFSTAAVKALLCHNPHLQEVSLCWYERQRGVNALLTALAISCPQLRYLDMSGLNGYTKACIMSIMPACTNLKEIYTDPECTIINNVVKRLWQEEYCSDLEFLQFASSLLPFWKQYGTRDLYDN